MQPVCTSSHESAVFQTPFKAPAISDKCNQILFGTPIVNSLHSILDFPHFNNYQFVSIAICLCSLKYVAILYKNRSVASNQSIQLSSLESLVCFSLLALLSLPSPVLALANETAPLANRTGIKILVLLQKVPW